MMAWPPHPRQRVKVKWIVTASDTPRIESLQELCLHCDELNTAADEREFWQSLAVYAASRICPPEYLRGAPFSCRQAIGFLADRRRELSKHFQRADSELCEIIAAGDVVLTDEINLVFQDLFQEDSMATATAKRKTKKTQTGEVPRKASSADLGIRIAEDVPADYQATLQSGPTSPASVAVINRAVSHPENEQAAPGLRIVETIDAPLEHFVTSPYQTRDEPPAAWLAEMAESLKTDGQTTPALARWVRCQLELIAGHTRHAAAKQAGWSTLRVQVCECDDATAARLVYIENAKRRELSPIEKARGLARLAEEYGAAGLTQQQLADDVNMGRSTVSNTLRLLKLPEGLQARVSVGDISIEQARSLATWAERPKVIAGFLKGLEARGLREGPIEKHHFDASLYAGFKTASRIMSKHQWGESCNFTPSAADKEALDIHEVPNGHGKEKRAFNVTLWKKLQDAANAKAKKKEEQKQAEGPKESAGRDKWSFERHLKLCWTRAFRAALARTCATLNKSEKEVVSRLAMSCYDNEDTADVSVGPRELLAMTPAEHTAHLVDVVRAALSAPQHGDWQAGSFDLDELRVLAERLGDSDPDPHFKPTESLIKACGKSDLQKIRNEVQEVQGLTGPPEIVAVWPAGKVPSIFELSELPAGDDDDDC